MCVCVPRAAQAVWAPHNKSTQGRHSSSKTEQPNKKGRKRNAGARLAAPTSVSCIPFVLFLLFCLFRRLRRCAQLRPPGRAPALGKNRQKKGRESEVALRRGPRGTADTQDNVTRQTRTQEGKGVRRTANKQKKGNTQVKGEEKRAGEQEGRRKEREAVYTRAREKSTQPKSRGMRRAPAQASTWFLMLRLARGEGRRSR